MLFSEFYSWINSSNVKKLLLLYFLLIVNIFSLSLYFNQIFSALLFWFTRACCIHIYIYALIGSLYLFRGLFRGVQRWGASDQITSSRETSGKEEIYIVVCVFQIITIVWNYYNREEKLNIKRGKPPTPIKHFKSE